MSNTCLWCEKSSNIGWRLEGRGAWPWLCWDCVNEAFGRDIEIPGED